MKNITKILLIITISLIINPLHLLAADWQIRKGEKLTYFVAFNSMLTGNIKGGKATLTVAQQTKKVANADAYYAVLQGETRGFVEMFYTVNNKYETYMDTKTLNPYMFVQKIKENKYLRNDTVLFDQNEKTAIINDRKMPTLDNTQDFVSMLFYVRKMDVSSMTAGDVFYLPLLTERKVINSKIIFKGKETIKTKYGTTECFAFKPQVATGKIFRDEYPATIWISADSKRLPVLVEAKMKVGKIKLELEKAE